MSLVIDKEQLVNNVSHSELSLTMPVNERSECALGIPGNVCSTKKTINEMKKFLVELNVDSSNLESLGGTINEMKKKTQCVTERCILENRNFRSVSDKDSILQSIDNLKPKGPSNSTALLSNTNIDEVLKKLTKVFKNFYHMHFQMIDFAGVRTSTGAEWKVVDGITLSPTKLGTINMVDDVIDKGYDTFGVVMNTDKRTNGGIHWFALFCDFRHIPYTVEYFNSSGNKPVVEIQDWMRKTEANINTKYKCELVVLSGVAHQTASETECGPYSLYYIYNRLNKKPAFNFQQMPIPDAKMIEFRKMLFA